MRKRSHGCKNDSKLQDYFSGCGQVGRGGDADSCLLLQFLSGIYPDIPQQKREPEAYPGNEDGKHAD